MIKQETHVVKGMQRDLTVSKFSPEYAFDAQNIRITARDHNTFLSITNEKGNKEIELRDKSNSVVSITGTTIGYNVLNNYLTLFTTDNTTDRIYRLSRNSDYFECELLYVGSLGFNTEYPIESLGVYENENIQKVYWVDGRNQARVINIAATEDMQKKWTDTSFNFVPDLSYTENIKVEKNVSTLGNFPSGVIQYAFTYYNLYGQESNIFYTTPLYYLSFDNRGANPEEKVSNSFTITINNPDTKFDYIRVYSICRTSIDATPTVTNIVDLPINAKVLTYTDNGNYGSTVDPTILLYVGGNNIVPTTLAQKDNTLFLGNILLRNKEVPESLRNLLQAESLFGFYKEPINVEYNYKGYYTYKNLLYNSSYIKGFKYLEWYRFGIQFQDSTGKWTEAVYIKDAYNTLSPDETHKVAASVGLSTRTVELARQLGYVRARGLVVYPSHTDREVIAQGILCPTVYNLEDRFSNSPFAQSSWFTRPYLGVDTQHFNYIINGPDQYYNGNYKLNDEIHDIISKGSWAEFRHNYPIPDNWKRNAEIQCLANVPESPLVTTTDNNSIVEWISNHKEYYFIDQSILTFHSPELEFDESLNNMDLSNVKLRIVGKVDFTSNAPCIDIQTSTPPYWNQFSPGFYTESSGVENVDMCGVKSYISGLNYIDSAIGRPTDTGEWGYLLYAGFMVYPWHRNGSLNNEGVLDSDDGTKTAMLYRNKRSNLKYSAHTYYLSTPWNAYIENDNNHTGISGVSIFNSTENSLVRLSAPENSSLGDINYYGNVDKVLNATRVYEPYHFSFDPGLGWDYEELNYFNPIADIELNRAYGYPISGGVFTLNREEISNNWMVDSWHPFYTSTPVPLLTVYDISNGPSLNKPLITEDRHKYGTEPVSIKYKSSIHAVLALNYTKDHKQVVLPTMYYPGYIGQGSYIINSVSKNYNGEYLPWDIECKGVYQDTINLFPNDDFYGYVWLAELYRDDVTEDTRFGGRTQEAFENNQWLPAGEPIKLDDSALIIYSEGDTYFQRYDCLKTYPYTLEDQNSVVEIESFMCETRINIDGRYDKNRGQVNNLIMTPSIFNLFNPGYSQTNNYFNYRAINYKLYGIDYFPNTITWSTEKQMGAVTDAWTNVTMASTLDLDGDKGEITSLNTFNNEIYCFQKQGLSNVLFNSRVQIPSSDGVPIEITNGLKVSGKRYISNTIGCNNKWSIAETPSGLYFIDNTTNSLYLFNGQLGSLSDRLGFRQWIGENNNMSSWNPINFDNFITFYDKNNNDVYFTNKSTSLVYSELLQQFTSFIDYGSVPYMFNINSDFYAIKYGKIWEQFAGEYNILFGDYKPYSITFISNSDEPYDKIFNNIEYRADCWADNKENEVLGNTTFDTLEVWNEYQKGVTDLTKETAKPSNLKKKFRVWRANIPRANTDWNGVKANKMDRIRNTWAYIKLSRNKKNTDRMEFHDMKVHYFI